MTLSSSQKEEYPSARVPLSPLENLSVGAFGGALETCLQMPILTYKFCVQEGRALPTSFAGWYRGVFIQASTVAPITALQFMVSVKLLQRNSYILYYVVVLLLVIIITNSEHINFYSFLISCICSYRL